MNYTPKALAVLTLAALCSAPAVAADGLHPLVGAAFTFGGDTLATVDYTDGSRQNIRSGGMLHLFGGVEYVTGNFALQVNLGYHVNDTNADNGSVTFSRVPVEVLGLWKVNEQVRLGGGLRKATGAKLTSSGAASGLGDVSLSASTGLVLQGEYFFTADKFSAFARYVVEDYTVSGNKVDGNHFGIGVAYHF